MCLCLDFKRKKSPGESTDWGGNEARRGLVFEPRQDMRDAYRKK